MTGPLDRALLDIRPLEAADRERLAALGLAPPDARVLGWWRAACHLLDRDSLFSVMMRDDAWHRWEASASQALEEALIYRENEDLLLALAIINDLLPGVYERAMLRGFKAVTTVLATCQRHGLPVKRERREAPARIEDRVRRLAVWVAPDGTIRDAVLSDPDRRQLVETGWREEWGVSFQHAHPSVIMMQVCAILDASWQTAEGNTLVAMCG